MQEDNQGVQYEYNVPYNESSDNPNVTHYTWTHSPWTDCSYSCGKGKNVHFYLFGSSDQTNNGSEISESDAVKCKCRK
jgi:hypothetical protein